MRTLEERIKVQGKQIEIYKAHIERQECEKEKEVESEDVVGSIDVNTENNTPSRINANTFRKSLTPRQSRPVQKDMFFSFKDGSDAAKSTKRQPYVKEDSIN